MTISEKVGLLFSKDERFSAEAKEFRHWYHTDLYGRFHAGHTFGDHLNDKERYAIIEFLKFISGENVRPKVKEDKWLYGLFSSVSAIH